MNPALFDSRRSVLSVVLQILSLPGLACAAALILFWPVVTTYLLGVSLWIGVGALAPWWYLLFRFAALVKLLACYFMLVLAVLGWVVLGVALPVAGVL